MSDGSAVLLLLRMAVSLAVVLALIVWAARVLNRRQGGFLGRTRLDVPVQVLARQSLSRHANLCVVQVGEEVLVLGVTDAEVSLLGDLDPATLAAPAAEPETAAAQPPQDAVHAFTVALRGASGLLPVRRDVKRQAAAARLVASRVADHTPGGGRHRG